MGRKSNTQLQAEAVCEQLADEIEYAAEGMRKLLNGRVEKRAIVLLIEDSTKVSKRDIEAVLEGVSRLDKVFLKKVKGL